MKVSDLIPDFYNKNIEMMNIIDSEERELEERLKPGVENVFKDTFAKVATERGIANFEKMFNIKPDVTNQSLELRREIILNRLVSHIPYSERYLINKLNSLLGEGNWDYTLDYNNYSLSISSLIPGKIWYKELLVFLEQIVPCNIQWGVIIYSATWGIVKDSFKTWNDISEMTWQELMDAEWSV